MIIVLRFTRQINQLQTFYFWRVQYVLRAKVYQAKKKNKYFEGTKNIVFKLLHRYVYKTNLPIVEHYIIVSCCCFLKRKGNNLIRCENFFNGLFSDSFLILWPLLYIDFDWGKEHMKHWSRHGHTWAIVQWTILKKNL